MKKTLTATLIGLFLSIFLNAANQIRQDKDVSEPLSKTLTMEEAITLARERSIVSMSYRNTFAAAYWNYRSYRAERLPSLNLTTNLMNFNRSIIPLQDPETGEIHYRPNYNLTNNLTLSIRQNITATGGTLSLYTSLERLDQYSPSRQIAYYSQPVSLSYSQPLWGFNRFKWDKKIEPHNYEAAKREFVENMEQVNVAAVEYFWNYAYYKQNLKIVESNYESSKRLYKNAQERFKMSTISKDNLLQLELKMLNDSLAISSAEVSMRSARNRLCSYIGYQEDTDIDLDLNYNLPELTLDFREVYHKALNNSSFTINQLISSLEAERSVAQAKANRGVTASASARFGLSNNAEDIQSVYLALRDQEIFGLSLNVPILDWGMGKGRVKMAQSQAEMTKNKLAQALIDYEQELFVKVMQFNNQLHQCRISKRAAEIAEQSYELSLKSFANGSISVTELNSVQSEMTSAQNTYLSNIRSFWNYYYSLRQATLYDFITATDINAGYETIIDE